MRPSGEEQEDDGLASSAPTPTTTAEIHTTASPTTGKNQAKDDPAAGGPGNVEDRVPSVGQGQGPGDPSRTVTCMRCQESMPFLLVPSHGAKCKGKKENGLQLGATAVAAPPGASEKQGLPLRLPIKSTESVEPKNIKSTAVAAERSSPSEVLSHSSISRSGWTRGPSPQTSPRDPSTSKPLFSRLGPPLSPPVVGSKAWHGTSGPEDGVSQEMKVPLSPDRSKNVRTWGTRQVTSWLRDIMRPPRADVISRFHDGGVDGITLLGITDRYRDSSMFAHST